jgi:dTDP-4-dehydrorhamnose reductase
VKVVIFGGNGLLGADIIDVCKDEHDIIALRSSEVDITDQESVYSLIKAHRPDIVINSAALTDVDKCEMDPDLAYRVNAMGPKNIAIACRDFNARMIQISTDYVFDGKKGEPYDEFQPVNPINNYGRSKVAGEQFVQMCTEKFMIIRTAWVFGAKRKHFVDYVVESINKGEEVIAVKDMISSPTYSRDLAEMIKNTMVLNETGIFHGVNKGYCSRVQMVEEIMKIMKKQTRVQVLLQSQWKKPAARPVFSALKNYHLQLMDKDCMAGWRDALKRYIKFKHKI